MWIEKVNTTEQQNLSTSKDFVTVVTWSSERTIKNNIAMALYSKKALPKNKIDAVSETIYWELGLSKEAFLWFEVIAWHLITHHLDTYGVETTTIIEIKFDSNEVSVCKVSLSREDLSKLAYKQEQEAVREISAKLADLQIVLNAMEEIFRNNTWVLWNGTLDEDDTFSPRNLSISPWKDLKDIPAWGMDLVYLQGIAQSVIEKAQEDLKSNAFPKDRIVEDKKRLWDYSKRYIDFIMGLSENYEWGAALFKESETGKKDNPKTPEDESVVTNMSESKVFQVLDLMIEAMSPEEALQYMADTHYKLDRNQYQSTEVERSYRAWKHKVHTVVLDTFKKNTVEDKYFLEYSKIVTGRPGRFITQQVDPGAGKSWYHNNRIDDRYRDPEAAQDALLYVCHRENGIISKIQTDPDSNFKVEDPKMWNLDPIDVLGLVSGSIEKHAVWMWDTNDGEVFLRDMGFADIMDTVNSKTNYHDLDIEQKMKIAILLRVHDSLNSKKSKVDSNELGEVFLNAIQDWQQVLVQSFEENFDDGWFHTKSAEDFNLTGVDSDIFELYMDIQGIGFWDFADSTINIAQEIGKMGLMFASAFGAFIVIWAAATAAGIALSPVIVAGIAGASMAWISEILYPKGYDNYDDLILDVGSDAALGALTWMWSVKMAEKLWKFWQWMAFAGWDLALWMWSEVLRSWEIETRLYGRNRYSLPEFYEFVELESNTLRALRDAQ